MHPIKTLVLLANEGEAKFLENAGVGKGLTRLAHHNLEEKPGYSDQPGHSQAAPGQAHHGFQPSTSEREQERENYADQIVSLLDKRWNGGGFDRLIIAAPPKMLGELRGKMTRWNGQITAELDKDLLKVSERDLAGHFSNVAAF